MNIDLTSPEGKKQITSVRSQIKDATSLRNFDDFVSKNATLDFSNDEHVAALRTKKNDCHCTVTTTVPVQV